MSLGNDEFLWVEKYRPTTIDECILPTSIKETFKQFVSNKEIPNLLLVGPPGSGKAQPLDAKIKTPNGWCEMGDLNIGDTISCPDGSISKVIGIFPQGEKNVYKITFDDGRAAECCLEHLWKIKVHSLFEGWRLVTTTKLLEYFNRGKYRIHIPLLESDAQEDINLPIDPYIFGCLLGDASFRSNTITLSNVDTELLVKFQSLLLNGYKLKKKSIKESCIDYMICMPKEERGSAAKGTYLNYYTSKIHEMGLLNKYSHEKFIPNIYKNCSIAQKKALICGLVDTDGTVSRGGSMSISTSSLTMANDIQYIVRSIGGICKIRQKFPKYTYNGKNCCGKVCYNISIHYNDLQSLCSLQRKKDRLSENHQYKNKGLRIRNIEHIGVKPCQCILIENENHLYMTDNFIVTHNTTVGRALCSEVGCETLFINGSSENGIDVFRNKITNYASTVSFSGGRKVVIIDEADYMNPNSLQPALRAGQESFSHNATFILTANYPAKIIPAIHSRCTVVDFKIKKEDKKLMLQNFFKRVCNILEKENIEYNKDVIATLIKKHFPDFRRIINELQRYSVNGSIDVGILSLVNDIQLKDLLKFLKEKDFGGIRTWVNANIDGDITSIYTKLYSGMSNFLEPKSIPSAILLMAKYQYQTSFVTDQEIQFMAFLVELMSECSFKSVEVER